MSNMTERGALPLANTIQDSCRRLGIGRTLLYDLLKQGKLRAIKLGSRTLIPETELQGLIAEQLKQAASETTKEDPHRDDQQGPPYP